MASSARKQSICGHRADLVLNRDREVLAEPASLTTTVTATTTGVRHCGRDIGRAPMADVCDGGLVAESGQEQGDGVNVDGVDGIELVA